MALAAREHLPQLRRMTMDDLAAVVAIEAAVSPSPWELTIFAKCLQLQYDAWVAEHAGKVVGFAIISLAADEAHILNIAVLPSAQRQGIGRALLQTIIKTVQQKQAKRAFLEVRASNINAQALYQSFGFAKIGIRAGYYHDETGSEDAWVFSRQFRHN